MAHRRFNAAQARVVPKHTLSVSNLQPSLFATIQVGSSYPTIPKLGASDYRSSSFQQLNRNVAQPLPSSFVRLLTPESMKAFGAARPIGQVAIKTSCTRSQIRSLVIVKPRPRPQSNFRTSPSLLFQASSPYPSQTSRHASQAPTDTDLKKTPLYNLHIQYGAKMVPFSGYSMPVSYAGLSHPASHAFTRSHASLFDVSHMVQHRFAGPGATAFLQMIAPISLASLATHQSSLSTFLWEGTGGIVDDCIITRLGPELFYVVTNAACREKDLRFLTEQLERFQSSSGPTSSGEVEGSKKIDWEVLDGWGLVAIQGPASEAVLSRALAPSSEEVDIKELHFGHSRFVQLTLPDGRTSQPCLVSRAGYTGEDGFEISIQPSETTRVTETLLAAGPEQIQLAGLGARDSLRLEAGMCLYGHDLDDDTTPVEAALGWVIGKDRRVEGGFNGAEKILQQLVPRSKGGLGVPRRRVGLVVEGAPAREGATIVSTKSDGSGGEDEQIGAVTSGCPSPTLGKNIAMGYVRDGFHKAGTEVQVVVRGKKRRAVVTKMPFVAAKYWKGLAPA